MHVMRYYTVLFLGEKDEDQKFIDTRMKAIKHKILVLSGKGGAYARSYYLIITINVAYFVAQVRKWQPQDG